MRKREIEGKLKGTSGNFMYSSVLGGLKLNEIFASSTQQTGQKEGLDWSLALAEKMVKFYIPEAFRVWTTLKFKGE